MNNKLGLLKQRLGAEGEKDYAEAIHELMRDFTLRYGSAAASRLILEEYVDSIEYSELSSGRAVGLIGILMEVRDPYTAFHQNRVGDLSAAIARRLGMPEKQVRVIQCAALVHDLGKIRVPSEILSKPSRLDRCEYQLLQTHPRIGADILEGANFPYGIPQIVLSHHERLDGTGYPNRLKGGQIPIESQIIATADMVEAIASHRPYRPGRGIDAALDELHAGRDLLFDADAVDACIACMDTLDMRATFACH